VPSASHTKTTWKHPTLKKTPEGYLLISSKKEDFLEEFRKVITSPHRRTGKPTNASPEEMKSIWDPTKRDNQAGNSTNKTT
jgi:hypothetical protein